MIFWLLFSEFFKIGLFALGGGMATVPFLFELAEKYQWFTSSELVDMIAVAESSPGPIGINMATYASFKTAGILGGIVATFGLVLPSFIIIIVLIADVLKKYKNSDFFMNLMYAVHPAVIALIVFAGVKLGKLVLVNLESVFICAIFWGAIHFVKLHPFLYILLGGVVGIVLKL